MRRVAITAAVFFTLLALFGLYRSCQSCVRKRQVRGFNESVEESNRALEDRDWKSLDEEAGIPSETPPAPPNGDPI